jgi:hypothetical protein
VPGSSGSDKRIVTALAELSGTPVSWGTVAAMTARTPAGRVASMDVPTADDAGGAAVEGIMDVIAAFPPGA